MADLGRQGRDRQSAAGVSAALAGALESHRSGRLEDAARAYRQVLARHPDHPDALHLLGLVDHQQGRHATALGRIDDAIRRAPARPVFHNNRGVVLLALGRSRDAADAFRRAVQLEGRYGEAHVNLGNALVRSGRADEALASYDRALALRPDDAQALTNKAAALVALDRLEDAEACCRTALARAPASASALCNLGITLRDQGRYAEALAALNDAVAADPAHAEARANRAALLLQHGRFGEGWAEYEWRWRTEGFTTPRRQFDCPPWDGGPVDGRTILVHAEQGLGTAIQFVRLLQPLARRGADIILECQRPLLRLFQGLAPRVIGKGDPLPAADAHIPMMSLPHRLGLTLDTIPAAVPYLAADGDDAARWRQRLAAASRPRIGLVWAGNPNHGNDRRRSLAADRLAPLAAAGIGSLFSLQVGASADQPAGWPEGAVTDLAPDLTDFAETAAAVSALDLVISVDTAVAHLAGALARPVWLLLPAVAEWRWLIGREDTPWYPTMTLFRQPRPGDWAAVTDAVLARLSAGGVG